MKVLIRCICGSLLAALASAQAATYQFSPDSDLEQINEEQRLLWAIPTFPFSPSSTVTQVVLSFTGIRHYTNDDNRLFFTLVDSPSITNGDLKIFGSKETFPGLQSNWFTDGGFAELYSNEVSALADSYVDNDPADTFGSYSYSFSGTELKRFASYLKSAPQGDPLGRTVAIGFDSDGSYDVEGLKLQVTIPDSSYSLALLGSALVALAFTRHSRK
ncbi:MAG: hypothetical protein SFV32_11940 [Opitutaceae bacterium]|nr:hypothetical protein [Opitutaceae bacterium]